MEFTEHEDRESVSTPQLAMTPMIDVVFLLIVFFLTVKFAERAGELEARLPKVEGVIPRLQQTRAPDSPEVWIRISPGKVGGVIEDGQLQPLTIALNDQPIDDFEDLHYELTMLTARIEQSGQKPFVVLDLDSELVYQSVASAINVTKRVGIENLNFTPPTSGLAR